jgi:hypothetical protein
MGAAGAGGAAADSEPAGQLGLTGRRQRPALFMANADPFDAAAAHRVGERVERVADQTEHVPDADLFENTDQKLCHRLRHENLLKVFIPLPRRPPRVLFNRAV